MEKKPSSLHLLPILFGFFVMGFVDVVGIASNYVKDDFALTDTVANLLPSMVFLWFFVFSVPTGILMNRIGRKNTVLLSIFVTGLAMLVPLASYTYIIILVAFALLGIGNTILQVALNPLLTNIVSDEKLASTLTLGQFVKAISAFLGPILAGIAASQLGNWKLIFPIYAAITLLSGAWLLAVPIVREKAVEAGSVKKNFTDSLSLLGDRFIFALFLGILLIVGVDVGMNTSVPKLLMERCGLALSDAGYGTSYYFAARTVGTFLGAIILSKISTRYFFPVSMILAMAGGFWLLIASSEPAIYAAVVLIGLSCANIFSVIFSLAMQHKPERANDISGLMIMGVAGGAIFPLLMGVASDGLGGQHGSVIVLLACMAYLTIFAFARSRK